MSIIFSPQQKDEKTPKSVSVSKLYINYIKRYGTNLRFTFYEY
jgi:hypothetical protein